MFTDIVGYTRMAQAKESLALELLEEHRGVVRPLISARGGTEVKTIGDAFLIEFKSALEAVLCAVDIQEKMAERNSNVATERQMKVRVGVHLGDVVHGGGDVYGDAVNVASRIEPLALPGGICISQQVYDNIRNKTDLGIEKMGEVELKNVELPVMVYRVNPEGMISSNEAVSVPRERLAVLPFVNISPDPNDEYFADGLTEELIAKLSEVKGLKVIARTSVMNYKKKEKNVAQIGRELGVGSIIEGSVRKAGNKIRVTVQLIDSGTEEHLWASNYDKELDDIFAIQTDVATKVAESVSAGLAPKAKETKNVEAYTLYLRGLQLFHGRNEPSLREALRLFTSAADRDPEYAKAYAGISLAYQSLCTMGVEDWGSISSRAEPAAHKAIELDPNLAEGHAALAGVGNLLDRFEEAEREAAQAVRLNPNLADAHVTLAIIKASRGDLDGSLASLEKAYELNPLSGRTTNFLSLVSLTAGRVQRSKEVIERMLELDPNNPRVIAGMAEYYIGTKDYGKAQEFLSRAKQVEDNDNIVTLDQGVIYAMQGKREEAKWQLKQIDMLSVETARLYGTLFITTALGDLDAAFLALDRMAELHSWPFLIGSLPFFAPLRRDSRYKTFARRVGLPAGDAPAT